MLIKSEPLSHAAAMPPAEQLTRGQSRSQSQSQGQGQSQSLSQNNSSNNDRDRSSSTTTTSSSSSIQHNTSSSNNQTNSNNNNDNSNSNSNSNGSRTSYSNGRGPSRAPGCNQVDGRAQHEGARAVTLIHFNDCYNIEPGPKSSGAAGFLTAVNQFRHLDPIILFSGDILSPSFMSTFTKGEQMIPVLNDIGVHCAVFGNHEFDYGVDNLIEFTRRTQFPWLLSNVIDKETSGQLGDGQLFHTLERAGLKFGLIGLIEEEWLSTLSTLDSSDVIYEDFVARGRELARWLKGPAHRVDFVIALTHFRTPNDIRLADSVPEIDLILGGHDHDYEVIKRPNCHIVKSGTDFREFSLITLEPAGGRLGRIEIERVECLNYKPDESLRLKLEKFVTTIDEKMGKVLGQFNCELDGRFSSIRKFETNLGNFVTDIMLASTHADLAILNSGTLRSDRVHARGDFTMRDLFNILGYIDPIAVLRATGLHIWKALENGVSQWPKLEGRFPQVSGCSFLFDPSKPPLARIDPKHITIGDEPLDLARHYKLTTKAYLASGKDGYDVLKECETLVPGDESPDLTTSILNHFEAINIVKSNRRTHHRQSIICLSRSSLRRLLDTSGAPSEAAPDGAGADSNNNNTSASARASTNANNENTNYDNTGPESEPEHANNADNARTLSPLANGCRPGAPGAARTKLEGDRGPGRQQAEEEGDESRDASALGPSTSSPLAGAVAPTPTLAGGRVGSLGTPPSTIAHPTGRPRTKRMMSLYEMEHEQCKLEPQIEGRIKILGVNWP